jgi:hypothetical protein
MELGSFKEGVALLRTARTHDARDHNLNRLSAASQLPELEGQRPAVPLNRWRPLVTAGAHARPL